MSDYLYRVYQPSDDKSEDAVLRLPNEARIALRKLLGSLSFNDIASRGLTEDQRMLIARIRESLD